MRVLVRLWLIVFCLVLLGGEVFSAGKRKLDEEYFRKLFFRVIGESLPWPKEDIVITRLAAEPTPVEVPLNAREEIKLTTYPRPGSNVLLVDYRQDGRLLTRVRVVGYVEIYLPVVVVKRPVSRFTVLSAEDLALERRPLTRLPQDVLTEISQAVGLRVRYGLSAGRVLRRSMLETPPLIRRNQLVRIVARSPHLTVTAQGRAREDGRLGEIIRVRNLASKKEIFARVVSPDTVEVSF